MRIRAFLGTEPECATIETMLDRLPQAITAARADDARTVVHRVVRGAKTDVAIEPLDDMVEAEIRACAQIAPAHTRRALDALAIARARLPLSRHYAAYDTAFHATIPDYARTYALPRQYAFPELKRSGYHGLNHWYCANRAAQLLERPISDLDVVVVHAGNGVSLCAIRAGRSVDTTMGFSPLEGPIMGSRSGTIDPGVLANLLARGGNPEELFDAIASRGGLFALTGTNDVRTLLAQYDAGDAASIFAFEAYVHSLRKHLGAMLGVLGGADAIVFTGGVGEHAAAVRSAICQGLNRLGIRLDQTRNETALGDAEISAPDSRARVFVVQSQEEFAMASLAATAYGVVAIS
ncbi:MAG: acetate/propionate family kinase [Vulcanimicrobiaceae bacterium]